MTDFKTIEKASKGTKYDWGEIQASIRFDDNGLIPGIAQQFDTKEVLMLAWLNRETLEETISTGRVCYWSRSRQQYWRKGEISGQIQMLKEIRFDCDGDAILLLVDQKGPACHTGRRSCFYLGVEDGKANILTTPLIDPDQLYSSKETK